MLTAARERLGGRATLVEHDLSRPLPALGGRFDAVVSSFAIHHLPDDRKRDLYAEVFDHLEAGGVFSNLEHVASPTETLQEEFHEAIGLPRDHGDDSNQLVPVEEQLIWLRGIGYTDVDCLWKWRELALLHGRRA
jgi:tRNA (cmo5U34)-methyltransferase